MSGKTFPACGVFVATTLRRNCRSDGLVKVRCSIAPERDTSTLDANELQRAARYAGPLDATVVGIHPVPQTLNFGLLR
jgi:hypothetical protein